MKRVLVVEDSVTTRAYYRSVLEGAGFGVDEAVNGLEGLERAMSGAFDLAIVDVNMPKMDGYAMIETLRRDPELATLPILTISAEPPNPASGPRGSDYHIYKPAASDDLATLARLLTGAAL
ncbi:two-component system, chemotaxis family, response regulator CheY [Rhodoblastus acidophilus]|uniref:Two-component system, chemotaxis family, response regulator CheY n=1 Tax=Rhodoblastus acidophilus TaxID=1074 RepID=A0A212S1F3_RHOAC|nr:response regulator [Rhodoblastus acidophilus]MCW2315985.1 two-component system chemotaxis response regulator CheY [Rhodoblastus acidophilus]PPQ38210.1 two-component system response regulator [Rhodoblastus acidophilus]RAI16873.1 two-component system response regulator [Rhodoblastus acidophilus]SNB78791.1 two-component system, chemotaxis family, response regulator CheY [Rhodoblastus acidophilus]